MTELGTIKVVIQISVGKPTTLMALQKNSLVSILYMGNVVGEGLLRRGGSKAMLQGTPLPRGCYEIQVNSILQQEPIPLFHRLPKYENITSLQEAIDKVVAWPFNGVVRLLKF